MIWQNVLSFQTRIKLIKSFHRPYRFRIHERLNFGPSKINMAVCCVLYKDINVVIWFSRRRNAIGKMIMRPRSYRLHLLHKETKYWSWKRTVARKTKKIIKEKNREGQHNYTGIIIILLLQVSSFATWGNQIM